jgi:prophage antirepressor-like protein
MQNIQIFTNQEFGQIEVLLIDGKPYFPASECAEILGYKNATDAVIRHCQKDGVVKHDIIDRVGRAQVKNYISEGNLYRLLIRSKLPAAVRFEAWLVDCVIPSIRQHGAYIAPETLRRMQNDRAFTDELLRSLEALQPKAQYFDAILQSPQAIPISIISKEYGMSAFAFNKLLHELGVQYRCGKVWLLYKDYANHGYTVTKTYLLDDKKISIHTCWTMKGRLFIYNLLKYYGILPQAELFFEETA